MNEMPVRQVTWGAIRASGMFRSPVCPVMLGAVTGSAPSAGRAISAAAAKRSFLGAILSRKKERPLDRGLSRACRAPSGGSW